MRVLVADDSRMMRKLIREALEGMGVLPGDVLEVVDGFQALALLGEAAPVDLILMDLNMPRMGGLELLTWVRAQKTLRDVPVIVITSQAQESIQEEFRRLGVSEYILKPFSLEHFREKVRKIELAGRDREEPGARPS